jgi:hypothetical protein
MHLTANIIGSVLDFGRSDGAKDDKPNLCGTEQTADIDHITFDGENCQAG